MNELVRVVKDRVVVDSRDIAKSFGKCPTDVVRSIDNLVAQNCVTN